MSKEQYCPNCQQDVTTILKTSRQAIGYLIIILCIIAGLLLIRFAVLLSVGIWGLGLLIFLGCYPPEHECPICNAPEWKLEKARKRSPLQSPEDQRAKKIDEQLVGKVERWLGGA